MGQRISNKFLKDEPTALLTPVMPVTKINDSQKSQQSLTNFYYSHDCHLSDRKDRGQQNQSSNRSYNDIRNRQSSFRLSRDSVRTSTQKEMRPFPSSTQPRDKKLMLSVIDEEQEAAARGGFWCCCKPPRKKPLPKINVVETESN